ncbi:TadE family protein [Allosalinactinospora lopnorensis]|uniref:TadE family protein n=1 Tax=Allosalinactinospora lopnorensis TaxID=1352348 RepID=UPI001F3FF15E|nr:TadE family protein [Allosalinactinospora lopnorensis]
MTRPRRSNSGERGSTTLEMAVLFPALLLIIMGTVQAGLWYHARSVALSAAQEGVRAGRAEGSSTEQAVAAAENFARAHGRDHLRHPTVSTAGSSATEVRVTVSGEVLTLVPGLPIQVSQNASGATERFTSGSSP